MNPVAAAPPGIAPVDEDLAEQARPGHGIPSQDPNPAAQISQEPQDEQGEVESVLMGGGVVAGVATGAAIGVAVAGPVGVVVGVAVGAVVGALGGAAAGAAVKPEESGGADSTNEPVDECRRVHRRDQVRHATAEQIVPPVVRHMVEGESRRQHPIAEALEQGRTSLCRDRPM